MIIGRNISGRYKIMKLIGGGGMSHVYLAKDMILDREVAIKVLRYDFSNEEELHKRFHREALSATSLDHPNIVAIYDVGEDRDLHYIVMEFIEGKTLKQYIQENSPLSPAMSVRIMKQLTSAIAHAHANGVIHRDIKPQNILMDREGNLKITDFGIATTLSATSYTQTNSVIGTVHYLSPEQARGGTATNQSDIYALGIVLYELLVGDLPFSGESAVAIALKHLQAETPSVRSSNAAIPQSLENVVLKATAKDLAHRYKDAHELERDLMTVLSPARSNEEKFFVPEDQDATRVLPVIKKPVAIISEPLVTKREEEEKVPPQTVSQLNKPVEKKKKKWPFILSGIILLILAGLLAVFLLIPSKIAVPNVVNQEVQAAQQQIKDAGFVVGEITQKHSEDIKKDHVISSDPKAELLRKKGAIINLVVSLGNETITLDSYEGRQLEQVKDLVKAKGMQIEVEEVYSDVAAGEIISQKPSAGTEVVAKDTTLVVTVSKGKELVKLADLKGYNESALSEYKRSSGLNIQVQSEEYSDSVPLGNVISQNPKVGTELEVGSVISVVISKGVAEKQTKLYVKEVKIPYTLTVPEENSPEDAEDEETVETPRVEQTVRIYIQDKNNTMAEPIETFKITEDSTYRIQLVIEEGEKAAYRISVDNNVIADETVPYDY